MLPSKQVNKTHYEFSKYISKERWSSIWHQLDEVIKRQPENVLEIGPGSGVFKNSAAAFNIKIETVDIDSELYPDHIGSATCLPLPNRSYDIVCAFQVLEHMEFDDSITALTEMARVARKTVIISLPDFTTSWASTITLPKLGVKKIIIPRFGYKAPIHKFDGEHYWEIGKKGYSLEEISKSFSFIESLDLLYTYRVHENQYHRFFVFKKSYGAD